MSSLYKDYEELLIKNEKLSKEISSLRYYRKLDDAKIKKLKKNKIENQKTIAKQAEEIEMKDNEISRLKALLNINGTNSGIPTSQTPISQKKVIPNTREKTNRKRGGQKGHKKHKLERFKDEEVTEIIEHKMEECPCCKSHKIKETGEVKEKDELDYKIVVEKKRYIYAEYECKECGKKFHEKIPNNLKEENQYGPQVQALELTLMNQANVTINKAQKITKGMTNGEIDLSEGYIAKLQKRGAENLEKFINEIRKEIIEQKLIHWDDTVIMVNTKRSCLRFYGNEKLALYTAHVKKDKEGLDEDKILSALSEDTIVEHDHLKVNYNKEYVYANAECNIHLLRDLQKVIDNLNHNWAKKLKELLSKMNKRRNWLIKKEKEEFDQESLNKFEEKFENIMLEAYDENTEEKQKYYVDKELTLINRILEYKNEYLLWVYNFDVPFTNNLSERALRGVKSKQKASGQFLNEESAKNYAIIRTYIETCERNGVNSYNALLRLSLGKPYSLTDILSGNVE